MQSDGDRKLRTGVYITLTQSGYIFHQYRHRCVYRQQARALETAAARTNTWCGKAVDAVL